MQQRKQRCRVGFGKPARVPSIERHQSCVLSMIGSKNAQ
jgi:hypothetical protein